MRKSQLIQKRKIAILATVRLMRTLVKDLEDNQKTFNRLLEAMDKLSGGDTYTMDIDFDIAEQEISEWETVVSNPEWPE